MIYIKEQISNKVPGLTSLYITFNYNASIVESIKSVGTAVFDKRTLTWEVPTVYLSTILDMLTVYDDIQLTLFKQEENSYVEYDIGPFKTQPFPYQIEGIKYALNHNKFLLLDGMGLGKTLQAIYAAQEIKKRDNVEHCLIICGVNTLKSNWKNEIQKHSNLSCRILGEKVNRKGKTVIGSVADRLEQLKSPINEFFVITNVETLRNDDISKTINDGKVNKFDIIIFDEMHAAKSISSQQGKNILKLKSAKYKMGLTGTLLLNSPLDAFMPLRWLGVQNCSHSTFEHFFCNYSGLFNNILIGYKNIDVLKDMLSVCSLRRTKDILELPPKTIINEYVDMNDSQSTFYDNIKQGIKDQVDKVELNTSTLLTMVTRLRQATACPSILTSENIESSKILRAVDLSEQIISNGSKVVIFSTFKETLNPLYEKLKNFNPVICTGDSKEIDIQKNINNFQYDDSCKIMLATWQKMGTGVTLTAANYAIFIDVPWTDAVYTQAQDRIYRIGTKDNVFIYHLICKDTIDEHVLDIVSTKSAIADFIIDDKVTAQSLEILKKYIQDLLIS